MKQFYLIATILLLSFGAIAQESKETPLTYVLEFNQADISNLEEFKSYVLSITQAESLEFNETGNQATINTYRVLDPKVINGKLYKFGVEYIDLKTK